MDPPPVVELRIFEGDGADRTDVTFGYNANFFLFTTLELARPIAHGRIQPQPQTLPVLTGMPVSGLAYLDRPSEAGYFIFPDLSVRHEGKYRLSFNLYEETKNPKDADAEPSTEQPKPQVTSPNAPNASFDWRLEVKSNTFTVYSAKKFPGLAESTNLSRLVAEQGCRVRIRRDVRMRRRDGKPNVDYEDAVVEDYSRTGRTPSIHDSYRERTRSVSNESADRQAFPGMERRMSGEYPRPYPYQASRPQSYLTFGGPGNQYQAPPPQFAQPAPPAPPSYQPAPVHHPHPVQFRQTAAPPQEAYVRPVHSQPIPPSNTPSRDHHEVRASQPPTGSNSGWNDADIPARGLPLPPIKNLTYKSLKREAQTPLTPFEHLTRAPLGLTQHEPTERGQMYPDRVLPPPLPAASPTSEPTPPTNKRTHHAAFDPKSRNQDRPLYNGMRPDDARCNVAVPDDKNDDQDDEDDGVPAWIKNMEYKRADGTLRRLLNPPDY